MWQINTNQLRRMALEPSSYNARSSTSITATGPVARVACCQFFAPFFNFVSNRFPQLFPKKHPPQICRSTSSNRNGSFSSTTKTPRHHRTLHQRKSKGNLCKESTKRTDLTEGGASERCVRREIEETEEAGDEYPGEC